MSKDYKDLLVALDIGTSKVVAIVAELKGEGHYEVIGLGQSDSKGLKKGVVVNIEATVQSIQRALEEAELMADCKITNVFTGIAGSHIRSFNSSGMVAIKDKEVTQTDVARVIETAKAINIPTDQQVLHILTQEFIIDGQEDVREPIGMSGIRLEVKVHIVTGAVSAAHRPFTTRVATSSTALSVVPPTTEVTTNSSMATRYARRRPHRVTRCPMSSITANPAANPLISHCAPHGDSPKTTPTSGSASSTKETSIASRTMFPDSTSNSRRCRVVQRSGARCSTGGTEFPAVGAAAPAARSLVPARALRAPPQGHHPVVRPGVDVGAGPAQEHGHHGRQLRLGRGTLLDSQHGAHSDVARSVGSLRVEVVAAGGHRQAEVTAVGSRACAGAGRRPCCAASATNGSA